MPSVLVCKVCGMEFSLSPYYVKRGAKYCTRQCAGIANRKWGPGEKGCWRCGETKTATEQDFYPNPSKHDGWSTECKACIKELGKDKIKIRGAFIAESDNKCQHCGIYNPDHGFFEIDHVTPIAISGKPRTQYIYDNDDYQVLCPNCHKIKTINDKEKIRRSKDTGL